MKKTNLIAWVRVSKVAYTCPHCKITVAYETDGLPPKDQCHDCLKPLKFNVIYLEK